MTTDPADPSHGDRRRVRPGARRQPLPLLELSLGPWRPGPELASATHVALLIRSGAIVREHVVSGIATADLLGPRDLVSLGHELAVPPIPAIEIRFTVVQHASVAIIDMRSREAFAEQPEFALQLLQRAAEQTSRIAASRALSHLPRVEQRLLAFFAMLAERYGRVGPDGIILPTRASHDQLGRYVGAQRPTVTLAIRALTDGGMVGRRSDGTWVLIQSPGERALGVENPPPRPARAEPVEDESGLEVPSVDDIEQLRLRVAELQSRHDRDRRRFARRAAPVDDPRGAHDAPTRGGPGS